MQPFTVVGALKHLQHNDASSHFRKTVSFFIVANASLQQSRKIVKWYYEYSRILHFCGLPKSASLKEILYFFPSLYYVIKVLVQVKKS